MKASKQATLNGYQQLKRYLNHVKTNPDYGWMQQYASAIYSSTLRNLGKAVEKWRKGDSDFPQFKSKKRGDSFTVLKKCGV
ncbi:hypothetical protein [Nostoc sp.]|uniref:hypothetical protein n=1 Tax=Nostoc sp. TaxID=1180 RepID=UPI002FFAC7DE